jgi:hypothetical protein
VNELPPISWLSRVAGSGAATSGGWECRLIGFVPGAGYDVLEQSQRPIKYRHLDREIIVIE